MNIAIFLFAYPVLSETFVINELFQLQQKGVSGSIWREQVGDGSSHPKVGQLTYPIYTCVATVFNAWPQLVMAHCWWMTHHPIRYLKLFWEVVRFFPDGESLKIFLKAVLPAQQVRAAQSQLVYVHESDRAFVFGLCAARLCNLPLVIIFHTYYLFAEPKYVSAKIQCSTAVIFQSDYSKNLIATRLGNPEWALAKLYVISSPGIDMNFFQPATMRQQTAKPSPLRLISIGRLEEAKGFSYLIEAVRLLKQHGLQIKCEIIGEGSLRPQLTALIAKHQLTAEVKLLGSVPHNQRLLARLHAAELFVLPSVQDSQGVHDVHPNAVKEAMAAGLLVLTTQLGGITEVINSGKDGYLMTNAQPATIAKYIQKAAQLPVTKKQAIKQAARQKIQQHFAAEQITQRLIHCFKHYV